MVEVKRYDAIKTNFAGYPKRAPRSDAEDLPSSKSLRLEKMGGSGTHAGGHLIQFTTSSRRLDGGAYCGASVGGKCMVSKAKLVLYAFAV